MTMDAKLGAGPIALAPEPDDRFTGYGIFGGDRAGRWGDDSAAVASSDGTMWFASEHIPGGPRTTLANPGTFVGGVTP